MGGTTSFYVGDKPWQRGFITTGAWREDTEDVVYGYSKSNPPTLTGPSGVINDIIAIFGGLNPDGFVSSTHFWYADDGDHLATTIRASIETLWWTNVFSFTVPNAYQKLHKYINGGWKVHYTYDETMGCPSSAFCMPQNYPILGIAFEYDNLIDFFKTGKAYGIGFRGLVSWQYCDRTLIYFGQEFREKITWQILGRMCHLIQDMSVPAHANLDPHGNNPGLRIDCYENYFGYDYFW
ncbi:MAG: hypothetical protein QMD92_08105 [bacterium]|nr:hypothetical protein [bacterium]